MPSSAPTVLEQVFDKVVGLLETITETNGYRTTVQKVEEFDVSPIDEPSANIFLGVFIQSHGVDRNLTHLSHGIECPATLILGIRAGIRSSVAGIYSTKKDLMCDIKEALFSDFGLGFLGTPQAVGALGTISVTRIGFQDGGVQTDAAAAYGSFLASFTVNWLEDPSNP